MLRKTYLSPKDAGIVVNNKVIGACERAVGYRFGNQAEKYNNILIRDIGKAIETMRYEQHKLRGEIVEFHGHTRNIPLTGYIEGINFPMYGEVDMIVKGDDLLGYGVSINTPTILEVKTVSSGAFLYRQKSPSDDHLLQVAVYCMLMDEHEALLQYIDRNDGLECWYKIYVEEIVGWEMIYNSMFGAVKMGKMKSNITCSGIIERYNYLVGKLVNNEPLDKRDYQLEYSMHRIQEMAETGQLTKSEKKQLKSKGYVSKGDYQCLYCPFKDSCWGLE